MAARKRKETSEGDCPESPVDFEKAFAELEQSVASLEAGKLSLDEALRKYEEGVRRFRECQAALDAAELRVEQLHRVTDEGAGEFSRFATDDEEDAAGDDEDSYD